MHPALKKFFEKNEAGTTQAKRSLHDSLVPLTNACAEAKKHVMDLKHQLQVAELENHDHLLDSKMEWMHTRLDAASQDLDMVQSALRKVARTFVEIENSFTVDYKNIHDAEEFAAKQSGKVDK